MRLLRGLSLWCLVLCSATIAVAQDPVVEVNFDETAAIPGQPLSLRVTVLVPTWLSKPVAFPSFEAPDLLVQLPEGASGPTSRTIDGETWSGVTRRYRITPMVPGQVQIPPQELAITWAEPGKPDPRAAVVTLQTITVEGIVPAGAEDLDPFLAAENITLTRSLSDTPMPLAAGDSVTYDVTAEIAGTSAMFLPQLLQVQTLPGLAAYPSEPVVTDTQNRGKVSGTRSESLTLVAQSGGGGTVPGVSLRWFNLRSGKIEVARAEGFEVTIDAPVAQSAGTDPRRLALWLLMVGMVALLARSLWRRAAPVVRTWQAARRARRAASEPWAYGKVVAAVAAQDFSMTLRQLDVWAARCGDDPRGMDPLQSALSTLGAARYSQHEASQSTGWQALNQALPQVRAKVLRSADENCNLPPLNPAKKPLSDAV